MTRTKITQWLSQPSPIGESTRSLLTREAQRTSYSGMLSKKLEVPTNLIQSYPGPLLGFTRERIHTKGYIDLLMTFGTPK